MVININILNHTDMTHLFLSTSRSENYNHILLTDEKQEGIIRVFICSDSFVSVLLPSVINMKSSTCLFGTTIISKFDTMCLVVSLKASLGVH